MFLQVLGLNAGALLDATDKDFTYTAFHYQIEKHNNVTSSAFKLDQYEKQLSDIGDNFQLIRAGMLYISLSAYCNYTTMHQFNPVMPLSCDVNLHYSVLKIDSQRLENSFVRIVLVTSQTAKRGAEKNRFKYIGHSCLFSEIGLSGSRLCSALAF